MIAKDLDDATDRLGPLGRLIGDLCNDDLALPRPADTIARDDDVVRQSLVVRHHEADTALLIETPDDTSRLAFQDLDQRTLESPAPIASGNPNNDTIPMEQCAHFLGVQIEVFTPLIRADEPEAVCVSNDPARDQIAPVHETERLVAISDQLAIPHHSAESAFERDQVRLFSQAQGLGKVVEGGRGAEVGEGFEDEFATWNRIGVFLRLALTMRVGVFGCSRSSASCHVGSV
jgi:hypothetical protein